MKKILILVAGESNLPFIQAAKDLGLYVITCDNNPSNPGHKIGDENLIIDVYNHEAIIEAVKDKNIDGVMSFVSAHGLNTASMISEHYHLKGYSQTALKTLTHKGLFRDFLSRSNLNFPSYQCVDKFDEIILEKLKYPVIIKPTDKGGSQGVIKINNESELLLNFQTAKEISGLDKVIIEEFIEGESLINGDCLIYKGKIIGKMIGNYIYDNDTNKVLPIATVFPAEQSVSEALKEVSIVIKTLEVPDGVINFEAIIRNNKAYIIEINPRPSGNYIWKLMGYKYCTEIPTFLINLYFDANDQTNSLEGTNSNSYAYQLIYSDKNKIFKGFEMPPTLKDNILDKNIFNKTNEYVNSFENLYDRIGIILLEFKDDKQRSFYVNNTELFKV